MYRRGKLISLAAAALLSSGACALAQTGMGPFTQAQVDAGRADYKANCAACHGPALAGGGDAPALTGATFKDHWAKDTARELWQFISVSMPDGNPGNLSDDIYINVVAYILAVNGATPGPAPFTKDSIVKIGTIADGQTVASVIKPPAP